MTKSLKDNYPEYEIPYSQKKIIPVWGIILLFLTTISVATFTFLVWSEKQSLNLLREAMKMVNEPIKISTPVVSIQPQRKAKAPFKQTEKIYSWTDTNGIRQFSNVQPTGDVNNLTIMKP